jgi:hypothetical protein
LDYFCKEKGRGGNGLLDYPYIPLGVSSSSFVGDEDEIEPTRRKTKLNLEFEYNYPAHEGVA